MIILSVSGGPGAQELKMDLFCMPERGKNLGGFLSLTALKLEEVTLTPMFTCHAKRWW